MLLDYKFTNFSTGVTKTIDKLAECDFFVGAMNNSSSGPGPTGRVTLSQTSSDGGSVVLPASCYFSSKDDGCISVPVTAGTPGVINITARYTGDASDLPSSTTFEFVVAGAPSIAGLFSGAALFLGTCSANNSTDVSCQLECVAFLVNGTCAGLSVAWSATTGRISPGPCTPPGGTSGSASNCTATLTSFYRALTDVDGTVSNSSGPLFSFTVAVLEAIPTYAWSGSAIDALARSNGDLTPPPEPDGCGSSESTAFELRVGSTFSCSAGAMCSSPGSLDQLAIYDDSCQVEGGVLNLSLSGSERFSDAPGPGRVTFAGCVPGTIDDVSGYCTTNVTATVAGLTNLTLTYLGNASALPSSLSFELSVFGPTLLLSPVNGPNGTRVDASGWDFSPNMTITFSVSGTASLESPTVCSSNSSGSFAGCEFTVVGPPETYTITATGSDGGVDRGTAQFEVLPDTEEFYLVIFTEQGLPAGVTWGVSINGTTALNVTARGAEPIGPVKATDGEVLWYLAVGGYTVQIPSPRNYVPVSAVESIEVLGSGSVHDILYTKSNGTAPSALYGQPGYNLTFAESGLPAGLSWEVALGYPNKLGLVVVTTNASITFVLPNATDPTYSFNVSVTGTPNPRGSWYSAPRSGHPTVSGNATTIPVRFAFSYDVSFDRPSAVSSGTSWTVTLTGPEPLDEVAQVGPPSESQTSINSTIMFWEPNGTYNYSVSTAGQSGARAAGTVSVMGAPASVTPVLSSPGSSGSGLESWAAFLRAYWQYELAAAVVVLVVGAIVFGRHRTEPPTSGPDPHPPN